MSRFLSDSKLPSSEGISPLILLPAIWSCGEVAVYQAVWESSNAQNDISDVLMIWTIKQDYLQNDKYSRLTRLPIWDGIGPDRALLSSTI